MQVQKHSQGKRTQWLSVPEYISMSGGVERVVTKRAQNQQLKPLTFESLAGAQRPFRVKSALQRRIH